MQDALAERELIDADAGRRDDTRSPCGGCTRAREALTEACRPCPERDGALRRELLCRCPVALGLRLLQRIERVGPDPADVSHSERASLDFQERALARRLAPFDADAVHRARLVMPSCEDCELPGCLHCRALRVLDALESHGK